MMVYALQCQHCRAVVTLPNDDLEEVLDEFVDEHYPHLEEQEFILVHEFVAQEKSTLLH